MINSNRISEFIQEDLAKSGLTIEDFPVTALMGESELLDRLGFKFIGDKRITSVGGYWIRNNDNWRLKLMEKVGDIKYLSPKGGGNHPYILPSILEILKGHNPDKPIIFTEGEKKACKAAKEGFPAIGLSGVWCFKDGESDFLPQLEGLNFKYRKCPIAFDSDITTKHNVRHAELRLAVELINRGGIPLSVRLPNEPNGEKNGLDDFLVRYGREKLQKLLDEARPTFEIHLIEGTPTELIVKEASRIEPALEREKIIKLITSHTKIPVETVRAEVEKHRPKAEGANSDNQSETFTEEEKKAAEQLLKGPDILSKMTETTAKAGYTGEETNQQTLFLGYTSRLMDKGINFEVKGGSASGKSTLTRTIQRLMPKQDVHLYSMITAKALVHCDFDLSHKILSVEERNGSEAADYSIRTIISEGEISILTTVKDEKTGNYKAVTKRIPAVGMVYTETTTAERVHNENQTRVFDLFMNESAEQNKKVIKAMGEAAANPPDAEAIEKEFRVWRCAQTLLKSYKVRIPFATKLSEEFPTDKTRVRRDFPRFLALIEAHCLLYQYRRKVDEKGYLVATLDDFMGVLPLTEVVLARSLKEISPNKERVLNVIRLGFKPEEWFSVKDLIEALANYEIMKQYEIEDFSLFASNNIEDLHKKILNYEIMKEKYILEEQKRYRTLQNYIKSFAKDGLLEWNDEKGAGSRYRYIYTSFIITQFAIFSPKFLESLKADGETQEFHNDSSFHNSTSNGANKEPKADKKECTGSTKTVVIDGELIRLEYDERAGTITVRKNGKTPYVCWDPEPGFQEYLQYFEGGV